MVGMADATFTAVDLSRLPAPDIIEDLDFETILAGAVAQMRDEMAKSGLTFETRDSDPATKLLQVFAYYAQMLRQRINDAARAVMPAYAVKADLDHIAALFGITRLTITPANPATGASAVMEDDTDFRRRMVLAPEGYSVAGPEGAYISHTLSADANVLDASATGPQPDDIKALVLGVLADHAASADLVAAMTSALDTARWPGSVVVSVLARTGDGTAPTELIDTVAAYVSDETRRPLTDWVTVQSARIVPYAVDATLTTFSGPDGGVVLAAAQASLDAYTKASHRLGRDITRSAIFAALSVEGVQNVILREPAQDIAIARRKGTAESVRSVVASFGGSVAIREWWQSEPRGLPHTFSLILNLDSAGAPASAAFVDQVIAEVNRAKPARSTFTFTQGLTAQAGIGLVAALRPTIYARLSCTAPAIP
jgi:phage tail P2-like protein